MQHAAEKLLIDANRSTMTQADLRVAENVDVRPHLRQLPHNQNFSSVSLENEVFNINASQHSIQCI